jgi:hypothetical protein
LFKKRALMRNDCIVWSVLFLCTPSVPISWYPQVRWILVQVFTGNPICFLKLLFIREFYIVLLYRVTDYLHSQFIDWNVTLIDIFQYIKKSVMSHSRTISRSRLDGKLSRFSNVHMFWNVLLSSKSAYYM